MDVARGVALLGILLVNALVFGEPFSSLMTMSAPAGEGPLSVAAYWFTMVFCTGKFYPLFSLLFGAGLAMMFESARKAGRGFVWTGLRRLVLLALFGVAHVTLLWYGDILLMYAIAGIALLILVRCSARTLMIIAVVLMAVGLVLATLWGFVNSLASREYEAIAGIDASVRPIEQFVRTLEAAKFDPGHPALVPIEVQIQRGGPFADAMILRWMIYLFSMVYYVVAMLWTVLGMFCLGAALVKLGFFHGERPSWRSRFIALGVGLGLPLSVTGAVLYPGQGGSALAGAAALASMMLAGPLMALMYFSLVAIFVDRVPGARIVRWLAQTGRMALTVYLMESVLMSAIMSHWGLAMFDQTTWAQRLAMCLGVYAALVIAANLWMSRFKYGPMEYLWRAGTYLRLPRPAGGV